MSTEKSTASTNEIEVTLLYVTPQNAGMFSATKNKTYWFAFAEIPPIPYIGNPFSTIRLTSVRNEPFPAQWIAGAKVRVQITNIQGKKGEGSFDVA